MAQALGAILSSTTMDGCRVYHSVDQAIADSTIVKLAFDSERYDNGGLHSTVTNNSRITVGRAGVYLISASIRFANSILGGRQCAIIVNNTTYIAAQTFPAAPGAQATDITLTTQYLLAATDYIEVAVLQTSGGSLNVSAGGNFSPEFSAQWSLGT